MHAVHVNHMICTFTCSVPPLQGCIPSPVRPMRQHHYVNFSWAGRTPLGPAQ